MQIYSLVKFLCKEKNISINELEKVVGLTRGGMSKWDISSPTVESLLKVANYFNVPLDYFVGRTITQPNIANENGIVGNNNAMTNSNNSFSQDNNKYKNFSEIEIELLTLCSKLDTRKKTALLTYAYGLDDNSL